MDINCMANRANQAEGGRDEQERPLYEKYASDPVPNQRQQDKLIAATWRRDTTILRENTVTLQPAERRIFIYRYEDLVHEAWNMVTNIEADYEKRTLAEIISCIAEYPKAYQVWTLVNFALLSQRMSTDEALTEALKRRNEPSVYDVRMCTATIPNVVAFTKQVAGAMEQIERVNGRVKAEEYLTSYRVAAGLLYGKQLEYMDQLLFLEQEANQIKSARSQGQGAGYRDPKYSGARSQSSAGSGSEQRTGYQPQLPREEKAKPADVGSFSSGGEVKKKKLGENRYESNDTGVGGVVGYIRSMHQVPIVIEGRTDYKVYQTPGTPEYLAKLKSDTAFAQSQVRAVAKAMKERVLEPDPENGSKRSPTSKFHLRMQGLFHPDSMNRYSDNSNPIEREKEIRAELFKAYQEVAAKNPTAEFYGLA